jgi:uncharacterized protein YecE (DUF72 family)
MLVGTSGWQYADWRTIFYPKGVAQRRWLEHYAGSFATVELNAAFYRAVPRTTYEAWRERTPGDFVMAVKASRVLTHYRRLLDPEIPLERMVDAARGLRGKLGPLLIQLPPNLPAAPDRLDAVLGLIPSDLRVVVEPRHESWICDEVRTVLAAHDAALGRPPRSAGDTAVADGGLGLSEIPRGHLAALAALLGRRHGGLGTAHR